MSEQEAELEVAHCHNTVLILFQGQRSLLHGSPQEELQLEGPHWMNVENRGRERELQTERPVTRPRCELQVAKAESGSGHEEK